MTPEHSTLKWRVAEHRDRDTLVDMNQQLQKEEGADVMSATEIRERFDRWFDSGAYQAVLFECDRKVVAYALFRDTDPDSEGADGVYLRQFFVRPECRLRGYGKACFALWKKEVVLAGKRVLLEVLHTNPVGQAFWQSVGGKLYSSKLEWHT